MKAFKQFSLSLLFVLAMTSCEGYRFASGTVVDANTGLPLDSVFVNVTSGKQRIYTDSTGTFSVHNQMGGCLCGCKDIFVEFSKNDYKTRELKNDQCSGTITLEN